MTRHVVLRPAIAIAVLAAAALVLLGAHTRAISSTSSFTVADRVTVNSTGEKGTVVAVPDASHVVVALDGSRAAVNSFQPDQIAAASTTTSPPPTTAPFPTLTAPSLSGFDQQATLNGTISESNGIFTVGYNGGSTNGYARGIFDYDQPQIKEGQDTWMGARYYLPSGFSSNAGYVSLMRRDNWPIYGSSANTCGVALWSGDSKLHAECDTYDGSWPTRSLIGGVTAPEGRWFTLELHQQIDSSSGSTTELYLDGVKVGSSTAANNLSERPTDRVRFGIVAIDPQSSGFKLQFTQPYVSNTRQPF
ncbi:MAG: hypothetical protein JSS99_10525 [Actinobacteria bacterium]|nr:hypothetical protein [Actinomycetota bacterium]